MKKSTSKKKTPKNLYHVTAFYRGRGNIIRSCTKAVYARSAKEADEKVRKYKGVDKAGGAQKIKPVARKLLKKWGVR